ncbi:MAG: DUF2075 domain-containing protein [Candidatus Aenigmarchaeota archaeon]|nr:DUF2075 domain-containing protein [Candidatus Aenigmarchaeota archaeon]
MIQRKVIYEAPQDKFFKDVLDKKVADIMKENFENISPSSISDSEYSSWDSTADEIKRIIEKSELSDLYICFEYQVPYTRKRIDCILFGKNSGNRGVVVHIEMKQWQSIVPLETEGNFVETYVGGGNRKIPHPSQQVEGYHDYLINFVEVFEEEMELKGYAYCHNYKKKEGEGLFAPQYRKILEEHPLYTKGDISRLAEKLKGLLSGGNGFEIFNKFMRSPVRPSKKLIKHISSIVEENKKEFSLLNDQIVAKNSILHKIKKSEKENEKNVVIIKGGPGTGKTVIALHILAELASQKKKRKLFFSTKSKPLREAIKKKVGRNAKLLFTNLTQFVPSRIEENELDILIVDEAHRIQKTSNYRFMRKEDKTDMSQVDQLVRCAKTAVFFIDDRQRIRGPEIGSVELIRKAAKEYGCSVSEEELISQFRCGGSDNYLAWIESVLGHITEEKTLTEKDGFDFKIFDSPSRLYEEIRKKNNEKGKSARLVAGFCWPWSKKLDENGELVKDVKIGNFEMPWETHMKISPPDGYVRWYEWAYKPEGIKQVGCIYTAQGFEFDYIGVIVGSDLKYDKENDMLVGDISETEDPMLKRDRENFDEYVRNIYRVLMTRGLKGCYVYFMDKNTEEYFKSRIKI